MPYSLIMDIKKTCAFTGHREVKDDLDIGLLTKTVKEFIEDGYDTFLSGMAMGFDLIAASVVLDLKKDYPHIKLIACVPCSEQERYFSAAEKKKYNYIIEKCDEVKTLSSHFYRGCMQARDRFMVDNCSLVIAYRRTNTGGTHYTVKYAAEQLKKICLL